MRRELIGQVGVDSGQLMISDPCYIEDGWVKQEDANIIGLKFWGQGNHEVADILHKNNVNIREDYSSHFISGDDYTSYSMMEATIKKIATEIGKRVVVAPVKSATYDEVCETTISEKSAGQIMDGLGVAFSSGLGDGIYDVYATYKDLGAWGERITKIEIELIPEEEADELND